MVDQKRGEQVPRSTKATEFGFRSLTRIPIGSSTVGTKESTLIKLQDHRNQQVPEKSHLQNYENIRLSPCSKERTKEWVIGSADHEGETR